MTTTDTPITTAPVSTGPVQVATRTLSTIALVAGIASIVFGQTFFVPVLAVILGILGYRQEPFGRAFAVWGIVLGGLALFGWTIVALVGLAFAGPFILFGLF